MRGLKMPRCGLITGTRSPAKVKPAARSSAVSTPAAARRRS
jgi:hypothetical protein